jgi:hypothetical protein
LKNEAERIGVHKMEDARAFLQKQKARKFLEEQKRKKKKSGKERSKGMPGMPGVSGIPGRPQLLGNKLGNRHMLGGVKKMEAALKQPMDILTSLSLSANSDDTAPASPSAGRGETVLPMPPPPVPVSSADSDNGSSEVDADELRRQIAALEEQMMVAGVEVSDAEDADSREEDTSRRHAAACRIQSHTRKRLARQKYKVRREKHVAARQIQGQVRRRIAQKKYKTARQRNEQALKIQKIARGRAQRRAYRDKQQQRHAAGVKLQKLSRGRQARNRLKQQKQSAVVIQSHARKMASKRRVAQLQQEKKERQQRANRKKNAQKNQKRGGNKVEKKRSSLSVNEARAKARAHKTVRKAGPVISSVQGIPRKPANDVEKVQSRHPPKRVMSKTEANFKREQARRARTELQNQLSILRQQNNKLGSACKKVEMKNTEVVESLDKVLNTYKQDPTKLLARLDAAMVSARQKLEDVRNINDGERDRLIRMHAVAVSNKQRILKSLEKAMAEIRYQNFQQASLRAAVKNMSNFDEFNSM